MKKFKIQTQRIIFGADENITEANKVTEDIIDANSFIENKDVIKLTEENISLARKHINPDYEIGDVHTSPTKSVSFFLDGNEVEKFDILADPYYKLFEYINGEWVLISKHKC